MKNIKLICRFTVLVLLVLFGCSKDAPTTLVVNPDTLSFPTNGGDLSIAIQTDAAAWSISNPASDWLSLSTTSGTGKADNVTISVTTRTLEARTATLLVAAGSAKPVQVVVSQPSSNFLYTVTSDLASISFDGQGSSKNLNITTDASKWNLDANVDWLQFSSTTGDKGATSITITATRNAGDNARNGTITVHAENAQALQINVTQPGPLYPNYNTSPLDADATGMGNNAAQLAAKIKLGWNIGNTLEATGGETAWGNPHVTKAQIDFIKQSGFNAVRIPCSWDQYVANSSTAKLKDDWLVRVKEVVQYCVDNDMYVLLNIHWDGGWLENNCTIDKQVVTNAKQRAFWEQIATYMRDFDEHLLFASANEPAVDNATQMTVLTSYHQTFIDAVRSTGGKNSYRTLVIQGPSTDIAKTNTLMSTLPTDKIASRMMVEIHDYTPWNFCGMTEDASWGNMFYYWGNGYHSTVDVTRNATFGEEDAVDADFQLMKTKFVDKGIPVVLGEFAVVRRSSLTGSALTLHLASRAYYLKYVTKKALASGILPFYWDNGGNDNNSSGIFNRNTNTVFDQQALDALVQGATE